MDEGGVKIDVYPNDAHPPAHGHVTGPKGKDPEVRIGPNGKPLKGETELTAQQKKIVEKNKKIIRKEINRQGKRNQQKEEDEKKEKKKKEKNEG